MIAAAAAMVAALVGVASSAVAQWTSGDTVNASISAGNVGLTLSGFDKLSANYSSSGILTSSAQVTVHNSSTLPLRTLTASTAIPGGNGSQTLASKVSVKIWPGSCASMPSTGVISATWATMPNWLANQSALAAAADASYCIQSSISATDANSNPSLTLSPVVTVTGNDYNFSTGAVAAASFTLATLASTDPQTVTPGQVGVSLPSGSNLSDVSITMPQKDPDWGTTATTNIDSTTGTIKNQQYTCMVITVTGQTTASGDWSFQLDNSVAPFNRTALTDAMFAQSSYQTARILAKPQSGVGVYTIGGIHKGSATTFNQQVWNDAKGSDGFNSYVWNTPIPAPPPGQPPLTTQVHLCLNIGNTPQSLNPGAGTFSVAQPVLAGCPDQNADPTKDLTQNPAMPAGSGLLTSSIPAGGNGAVVCLYVKLTGLYPHFYIGYSFSIDWKGLLANSGLSSAQQQSLASASAYNWKAYGSDLSTDQAPATLGSDGTLNWSIAQQHTPLEITNGMTVVLTARIPLPAP
ncbi:hypothetical protein D7I44_11915 [Gryllotalpicola protaetiae]|uniref:Uncharacterized protein n=2 Tax=Gryllotalpicola protaetiae TaxID=2419771 RepID=A0A387BJ92_9MICO|nr:hypothetical protein D7I44_11915 [Gryllotalpicola protaetiae]